jgi:hypothetical protein
MSRISASMAWNVGLSYFGKCRSCAAIQRCTLNFVTGVHGFSRGGAGAEKTGDHSDRRLIWRAVVVLSFLRERCREARNTGLEKDHLTRSGKIGMETFGAASPAPGFQRTCFMSTKVPDERMPICGLDVLTVLLIAVGVLLQAVQTGLTLLIYLHR